MRTLFIEPFSGASGDMILGCLVDMGADKKRICTEIKKCVDVCVSFEKLNKCGIAATKAHVSEKEQRPPSKTYIQLREQIKNAGLEKEIENDSLEIFKIMAEAEAKVHGVDIENVHFHEVGQDDAVADVVGCCTALWDLKRREEMKFDVIECGIINTGSGFIKCAHGVLPVPAPATLEILKKSGLPYRMEGERELLTPTGAAILAHFVKKYGKANKKNYGGVVK